MTTILYLTSLLLLFQTNGIYSLVCDSLTNQPEGGSNSGSFKELEPDELRELTSCLSLIGQSPLEETQAQNTWNNLKKFYPRVDDIPIECFNALGWALIGIPVDDFQNITMDNINIIQVFGKYHGLKVDQMNAIVEKIEDEWTEKNWDTFSEYDLRALGQILCHFNESVIEKIHPDAYKEAAEAIGALRECPSEITAAFAQLATDESAFGDPGTWSKYDVLKIGSIVNGLEPDQLHKIPEEYINDLKKTTEPDQN